MIRTLTRSMNDQMLRTAELYLAQGGQTPINLDELARFAIRNNHWEKRGDVLVQLCKRDFSRAFREQYHTDPQGREVRTWHAAKSDKKQGVFWDDIRTAPAEHMEDAFTQRRNQIVGDCLQLKKDVDSFNDNNAFGAMIQMVFDFTEDIAEREQPTDYRPTQPR